MTVVARSRVAEGVELVELDDPGRYNALTVAMVSELRDTYARALDEADAEQYVRENPTKAVVTALGIGFVLGMIFRR